MQKLWTYIEGKMWRAKKKYALAFLIPGALFALTGLIAWVIIRNWALSSMDWMVCFIGYPIVISSLIVFLYAGSHRFHNGIPKEEID